MNVNSIRKLSSEEISKIGESFYFTELKDKLEKEHNGEYVVIDVQEKQYVTNQDLFNALTEAKKRFGDKLFFIIQVGSIEKPSVNYKDVKYAWVF